jgi:hypothetical protein
MDSGLIFFIIAGIILWVDYKRRNANIKRRWESIQTPIPPTLKPLTLDDLSDDSVNMLKVISSVLISGEEPPVQEDPDSDDEILKETIREVMEELETSPEEINDATMALKRLGYKPAQIKKVITIINSTTNGQLNSTELVTRALPILNN